MEPTTDNMPQSSQPQAPFESLTFMFNDRPHGRILLRILLNAGTEVAAPGPFDDEFDFSATGVESSETLSETPTAAEPTFAFHYELGAAGRDTQDDLTLTFDQVTQLQKNLVDAGVYLWDAEYGDSDNVTPSRWNLTIVLKKDVFTQSVRGGSDYPEGFSKMMEAFHRIGLPRGERSQKTAGSSSAFNPFGAAGFNPGNMGSMNPNDMFAAMQDMLKSGAPQEAMQQLQDAMNELRDNPQGFQERLRSEFKALTPEQQNELLNMLGSTGMVSREWWENFFRG